MFINSSQDWLKNNIFMKVLIIANNIDGNVDGIGKHARIVGHEMNNQGISVDYVTGSTWKKTHFQLFFSFEMTKAYLKAMLKILSEKFDYVNVEYPFREYNPLILIMHILLWTITRFVSTKVSFSMHEHDRVKKLRRLIIDCMLPFSDIIFISEEKYKNSLIKYAHKMYLRIIPSHGIKFYPDEKDFKSHNRYCYFGLVNSSKAFKEMLAAWDVFNKEGEFYLDIVSITDLRNLNLERHKGVKFYYNLSDADSGKILSRCIFSIIPVLPNIGYNNSSFVSTIQCGCIPIGIFNRDLEYESFVLNMNSYSLSDFVKTLRASQIIVDLKEKSKSARNFGRQFSVERTAEMMIKTFTEFGK